jgi:hypothetical protein
MDTLDLYRNCIQQLLRQYTKRKPSAQDVDIQVIADTLHDHYQIYHVGWQENRRVHGCLIHLDIYNGKIWIQYNGTEESLASALEAFGVPKEDIVLGCYPPYYRKFTDYSVN